MGRQIRPRKGFNLADYFQKGRESCMVKHSAPGPAVVLPLLFRSPDKKFEAMNAQTTLTFDEMLRIRLEVMRREHRDLDEAIHALETGGRPDALTLRRLKKQKLALKDQIVKIEDQLIPNIIA
jgi:hypothetical protein